MKRKNFSMVLIVLLILTASLIVVSGCANGKTATAIPHPIDENTDCLSCHEQGVGGATKMPHKKRDNCTNCHKPEK